MSTRAPPKLTWATAPELVLLTLFDALPLRDVCQVNLVHRNWGKLRAEALSHRKGNLTVLIGDFWKKPGRMILDSCFNIPNGKDIRNQDGSRAVVLPAEGTRADMNKLQFSVLTASKAIRLAGNLPNITSLVIAAKHHDLHGVTALIRCYAHQLTSLKVFTLIIDRDANLYSGARSVFEAVNLCTKLKSLTIEFPNQLFLRSYSFDFPVLAHLEHFYFYSYNDLSYWTDSLERYALNNPELKTIGLMNPVERFRTPDPVVFELIDKLTHASLLGDHQPDNLTRFFNAARSLRSLTISTAIDVHLFDYIPRLVSMNQLIHLHIDLYASFWKERQPPPPIEGLPSVRSLTIACQNGGAFPPKHNLLAALHLHTLFPLVQVIELKLPNTINCRQCGSIEKDRWMDCMERLASPLRACAALRVFRAAKGTYAYKWYADEL